MKAYKFNIAIVGLLCLMMIVAGTSAPLTASVQDESMIQIDNVLVEVERDGEIFYTCSTHNIVTNIGDEYHEQALTNLTYTSFEGVPIYVSVSNTTDALSTAWTQIPDEITTGGLARVEGTYTSLGIGYWKISHEFTASANHTAVQTMGLNWKTGDTDNCLFATGNFTAVDLEGTSGDKITITWTGTAT